MPVPSSIPQAAVTFVPGAAGLPPGWGATLLAEVLPTPCMQASKANLTPHPRVHTHAHLGTSVPPHMHTHIQAHSCPLPNPEAGGAEPLVLPCSSGACRGCRHPALIPRPFPTASPSTGSPSGVMEQSAGQTPAVQPPPLWTRRGRGLPAREVTVVLNVSSALSPRRSSLCCAEGWPRVTLSAASWGLLKGASTIPPSLVSAPRPTPSGSRRGPATLDSEAVQAPGCVYEWCQFQGLGVWKGLSGSAGPTYSF